MLHCVKCTVLMQWTGTARLLLLIYIININHVSFTLFIHVGASNKDWTGKRIWVVFRSKGLEQIMIMFNESIYYLMQRTMKILAEIREICISELMTADLFNFMQLFRNPCWRCYQSVTEMNSRKKKHLLDTKSSCYHIC